MALTQQTPLPISVHQDTALVKDPVQEKRSPDLNSSQVGYVNLTAADSLQADSQLDARRGTIVGKREQQVEIRVGVLVAPRQRAIEDGQTNARLGTQRPAKPGEQRPMSLEILALA